MIEPGKVLQQRYRIDGQIGQGGMGAVYVATDERFGSVVAIKETLFMDDNYRKAIEREARLLNSLKHAALPRVTDHFLEENGQFLVMEYIAGEDLAHTLTTSSRPFPVGQVMTWADQLLDALDYLHNQVNPVIHRDIKPQNLKVTPKGQIILLDFGLAKGNPTDAGHQTAAKSIFGYSRNYASLEQIQGTGTDPRSDLYSLAATLYHLLTNTAPEDALTRAMAVLSHQPDPLLRADRLVSEVPAGVAFVLEGALALNASRRPATASEMRTMLRDHERYAEDAAISTAVPTVSGPNTEIFSQRTQLMPGSTIHDAGRQTDVKTEVLPGGHSQLTAIKNVVGNTSGRSPRRRMVFAAAGVVAILLAATVAGGVYVFRPDLFHSGPAIPEPEAVVPPADETQQAAEPAADASIGTPVEEVVIDPTTRSEPGAGVRSSDTVRRGRSQPAAKQDVDADDPDRIVIDGETIYMGNTRITKGRIETPDRVIDENGVSPRVPEPPNLQPGTRRVPPPDMRRLTPDQRRRLMRSMRRSGTLPRPTP